MNDVSLFKQLVVVIENFNNDQSPSSSIPTQKKKINQIAKRYEIRESPSFLWEKIKQESSGKDK